MDGPDSGPDGPDSGPAVLFGKQNLQLSSMSFGIGVALGNGIWMARWRLSQGFSDAFNWWAVLVLAAVSGLLSVVYVTAFQRLDRG